MGFIPANNSKIKTDDDDVEGLLVWNDTPGRTKEEVINLLRSI